ncbi:hypothetical protein SAMN05444671_4332 [Flavobacterium sp. CF108]|uniref:hypothetical protein n=1 Tax=Flavobacterium sp. CF108 TaxID=1882758 RepID=UPI00091217EF|nr:hypothetical protein [Flavobacterium sp. CF108]SHH92851.1 hypothetical protein SAMN05444671_4332 [Flavobacterium sp. CF108]
MARSDDGCFGIFGAIVIIILVIVETFKGNFIPILIIAGIFLLFKIFIWWSELKRKNDQIRTEGGKENNYGPYLLGIIILGGILVNIYFKNNHRSTNTESIVSDPYPISQPTITKTEIKKEIPKEILWSQKSFGNTEFQLPENMFFKESLSNSESQVYIDDSQYLSLTITGKFLDEESKDKRIDDFSENLKAFAESFNENNRRNFDDFKLENYEITSFGNVRAIKIQQTSSKVSGKNIEILVTSYEVIANPYYYDITFSYPKDSVKFIDTFEKISKLFVFTKLPNNNQVEMETSADLGPGYYVVVSNLIDKIYFYDKPDDTFIRKAFLVGDEKVFVEKISNSFGYIEFKNNRGLISKGWVKLKYLDKIN